MSYEEEIVENVDDELKFYLEKSGTSDPLYATPVVQQLLFRAQKEACESPEGVELIGILRELGLSTDLLAERVGSEVTKRWGRCILMPGVPTKGRCTDILGDLLREYRPLKPKPVVVPPAPKKYVNLLQDELIGKELAFVVHCVNWMLVNLPSSALQPKLGVVRLTDDGVNYYDYAVADYEKHVHEIVRRQIPTVYPLQTSIMRSY